MAEVDGGGYGGFYVRWPILVGGAPDLRAPKP